MYAIVKPVALASRNNRSVRVKEVVYKINSRCSNPLFKDTKECIVYWQAIDTFNKEINHVYHTMKSKDSGDLLSSSTECDENPHSDECRTYEL